jgi:hypothetical protein
MSTTRITTLSYMVKRLKDSGYNVSRCDALNYTENDKRKWTIVVDNGVGSVIITCMKTGSFHFYDGLRFFNSNLKLNTESIEVIIQYLNEKGIVNKHWSYGVSQQYNEIE